MAVPPALTVIVPGLIWPGYALADLAGGVPTPGLDRLLGRGRLQRHAGGGRWASLCAAFGQPADLAAAPLRRLGLGCSTASGHWLCLDPVHLGFQERRLTLDDPSRLQLTDDEAQALAVSLAPTFAAFGDLAADRPGAWHLRLHDGVAAVTSPPLAELVGRRADGILAGLDRAWRQALNEAQMQLHAHPVNHAREAAGKPVVNSLWPWGDGSEPAAAAASRHDTVLANDTLAAGLARQANIPVAAVPAKIDLAALPGRHPLLLLDDLDAPARTGDAQAWRAALAGLDTHWFTRLAAALPRQLTLRFCGDEAGATLQIGAMDRLAVWRRPQPLATLADLATPAAA